MDPRAYQGFTSNQTSKRPLIFTAIGVLVTLGLLWRVFLKPIDSPLITKAVAVLDGFGSGVEGTITFEQSTKTGPVTISGLIKNLDPSAKRGFHIHQYGNTAEGCNSAGAHFNPLNKNHGAPTDADRHVGDLGNVDSDYDGAALVNFEDNLISLNGPLSVVGRAVVVHTGTDDLGRGDSKESLKTGNAGARAACGVIGVSSFA